MQGKGPIVERLDNSQKPTTYIRDTENSMLLSPLDHHGNKFMGSMNKLLNLNSMLNYEDKQKYLLQYQARFHQKLMQGSIPLCFDKCITDVERPGALNSEEKNCVRECYFKRLSSKDDLNYLIQQRLSSEQIRELKEQMV